MEEHDAFLEECYKNAIHDSIDRLVRDIKHFPDILLYLLTNNYISSGQYAVFLRTGDVVSLLAYLKAKGHIGFICLGNALSETKQIELSYVIADRFLKLRRSAPVTPNRNVHSFPVPESSASYASVTYCSAPQAQASAQHNEQFPQRQDMPLNNTDKHTATTSTLINCIVCFEDLPVDIMRVYPCGHLLCKDCVQDWRHKENNLTCPNCMVESVTEPIRLFLT